MVERLVPGLGLLVALGLAIGCNQTPTKDPPAEPDDRPRLYNPDPSPPAPTQTIPAFAGPSVGMQPGYLDGGFLFASVRMGALQDLVQSLPLAPDISLALAEIRPRLGADPRVDDVVGLLGIDPDARSSLSIRPLVDHAGAVKQGLAEASPLVDELIGPDPLSADAERFLDQAETLGVHLRGHLPIADFARSAALVANLGQIEPGEWATTCAALQPTVVCTGASDHVIVVRKLDAGVQVDVLLFFAASPIEAEADTELRRGLVQQAVALPSARSIPSLGALRGDAAVVVLGTPTLQLVRAKLLTETITNLRGYGRDALAESRRRDESLLALHDADRLFEGIEIEANLDRQRIHANLTWLPTALGSAKRAELFELRQVDADVPSLASACADALVCVRSRGLPSTARFESLATAAFAEPETFEVALKQAGESSAMLLMLLESWPNFIGMLAKVPGSSMDPAQSVVAKNAKQALEGALAFGLVVRKLEETNGQTHAEWVGYARVPAMDLDTVASALRMGAIELAPVTIEGVPGSISMADLPTRELLGRYYAIHDPPIETGSWGWAVAADADERVRWLASLPRDDGSAPIVYLEVRDLWRSFAGVGEFVREFGHIQAWASGRSLRAQLDLGPTGPELRVLIAKPTQSPGSAIP